MFGRDLRGPAKRVPDFGTGGGFGFPSAATTGV